MEGVKRTQCRIKNQLLNNDFFPMVFGARVHCCSVHYWGIVCILVTFIAFSTDTIIVAMFADETMYLTKLKALDVTDSIWQSIDIYVYKPGLALIQSKTVYKLIEFVWIAAAITLNCTYYIYLYIIFISFVTLCSMKIDIRLIIFGFNWTFSEPILNRCIPDPLPNNQKSYVSKTGIHNFFQVKKILFLNLLHKNLFVVFFILLA